MATVACPGCGLPRDGAEVGATPCPVCASTPATGNAPATPRKKPAADPTAGLPADASELNAPRTRRAAKHSPGGGSRVLFVGTVTFLLGTLFGAGCVLGFRAINWPQLNKDEPEVATKPEEEPAPTPHAPRGPAIAPMPHEPGLKPIVIVPSDDPEPDFKLAQPPPPPGRITLVELNQPEAIYAVPFPMKKGEHVVLKGKVKTLRVTGLDAGAILDASALEASIVTVTGKIDNRSTLKLNAPNGTIHVTGKIDGKSVVEINALGGEVKFMLPTTPTREGSKIDGGSTVSVTARMAEFKGDITGTDTKVTVILTRSAILKVAAISGRATVEYKSQAAGWSPPDVTVGFVSPTAIFRKIE